MEYKNGIDPFHLLMNKLLCNSFLCIYLFIYGIDEMTIF